MAGPLKIRAACRSCGWTGTQTTGWVRCDTPEIAARLEADGFKRTGLWVRVRLRQVPCPKCRRRALAHGVSTDDAIRELQERFNR